MATRAKPPAAAHSQKGTVRIRTQGSSGKDEVQLTSHGCFLKDRNRDMSCCCNCFTVRVKGIQTDWVTSVVGLNDKLKHDVILSDLKKMLHCDGRCTEEKGAGVVIHLNTTRAEAVKQFLWKNGLAAQDKIQFTRSL